MKKHYNAAQNQIGRMGYESYLDRQEARLEVESTQVLENNIRTKDLGLVALAMVLKCSVKKVLGQSGVWYIEKNTAAEKMYGEYKDQEKILVNVFNYGKTLVNLLNKSGTEYA